MEKNKVGLWITKALLFAGVFTIVILLLLALLMYRVDLSLDTAAHIMVLIYVGAPFLGALYLGKKVREKRYLWGFVVGVCYFVLFLTISLLAGGLEHPNWLAELRVFFMAAVGGILGGMLS